MNLLKGGEESLEGEMCNKQNVRVFGNQENLQVGERNSSSELPENLRANGPLFERGKTAGEAESFAHREGCNLVRQALPDLTAGEREHAV